MCTNTGSSFLVVHGLNDCFVARWHEFVFDNGPSVDGFSCDAKSQVIGRGTGAPRSRSFFSLFLFVAWYAAAGAATSDGYDHNFVRFD